MKCHNPDFLLIGRDMLKDGYRLRFEVKGGSMRPFLATGDIVTVETCPPEDILKGDIVFSRTGEDKICVHRVAGKKISDKGFEFTLKGDAWPVADRSILSEDLLGRVVARQRNKTIFFLDTKRAHYFNLFYLFSSYIVSYIVKFLRFLRSVLLFPVKKILSGVLRVGILRSLLKRHIGRRVSVSRVLPEDEEAEGTVYLTARYGRFVIGSLCVSTLEGQPGNVWWITGLSVNWLWRGIGAGKRLVQEASRIAAEHGAMYLRLYAFCSDSFVMSFYRSFGFQCVAPEDGLSKDCRSLNRQRVLLEKKLGNLTIGERIAGYLDKSGNGLLNGFLEERVAPFMYKIPPASYADRDGPVSGRDLEVLKNSYYTTLARNIKILDTFKKIAGIFKKNKVKAIFFKGPVAAVTIYGDVGLRPMTDIDILVRREDIFRVAGILSELGYSPPFEINEGYLPENSAYHNSLLFKGVSKTPEFVHIYWHLVNLFLYDVSLFEKFDMERVWADSCEVDLDGFSVLSLSDEDSLVYFCLHAFKHGYTPFILLLDIFKFLDLKKLSLDWQKVVKRSMEFGLYAPVYYSCFLASGILGADVPSWVLDHIRPKKMSCFEKKFLNQVLSGISKDKRLSMTLVYLGMNDGLINRLKYVISASLPSKKAMSVIKQKDISQVTSKDYISRLFSSINLK